MNNLVRIILVVALVAFWHVTTTTVDAKPKRDATGSKLGKRAGRFQCMVWNLALGAELVKCTAGVRDACKEAVNIERDIDQQCNQDSDTDGSGKWGRPL